MSKEDILKALISWFNRTAPRGSRSLESDYILALWARIFKDTGSGFAHFYAYYVTCKPHVVCVHDGTCTSNMWAMSESLEGRQHANCHFQFNAAQ